MLISRKNVDVQNKDSARRTAIYFSSLLRFWLWTVQLARDAAVKFRFHSMGRLRHILMGLKGQLAVFPSDKFTFSSVFTCSMLEKKSVKHFSFYFNFKETQPCKRKFSSFIVQTSKQEMIDCWVVFSSCLLNELNSTQVIERSLRYHWTKLAYTDFISMHQKGYSTFLLTFPLTYQDHSLWDKKELTFVECLPYSRHIHMHNLKFHNHQARVVYCKLIRNDKSESQSSSTNKVESWAGTGIQSLLFPLFMPVY